MAKCRKCKGEIVGRKHYPMGYGPICERCANAAWERLKKAITEAGKKK